tara:strand:- start:3452 stop:3982 length:531 start_codon:yes stop_codon:yes gene_type:complete
MNQCPYKNYRTKVLEFIDILRQPKEEYGGFPPCPFVGAEIDKDKLMIELFDPSTNTILEMLEVFVESKYDSALFVQVTNDKISAEETFEYQSFINRIIKKAGYDNLKCICFNPNDSVDIDGFNVRQYAPYFLINIANRDILSKAHKKLLSTKYFDNMEKEYLDYLHVKEEHLRRNK